MKKLFLSLTLAAAAMLTACEQKSMSTPTPPTTQDNEVTFNVGVDMAHSRSGYEFAPNRYMMQLFSVDDATTPVPDSPNILADSTYYSGNGEFTVRLEKDQSYAVLFWADYSAELVNTTALPTYENYKYAWSGYTIDDLRQVSISDPVSPMQPAYNGSVRFTYDPDADEKPYLQNTLTHAVAQVNFVQNVRVIAELNIFNVEFSKAFVANTADLSVRRSEYTAGEQSEFKSVAAGETILTTYVIADSEYASVLDINYTFNGQNRGTVTNVEVQRNYRTFITGDFSGLGGGPFDEVFTVTVDENWNEGEPITPPLGLGSNYNDLGEIWKMSEDGTKAWLWKFIHTEERPQYTEATYAETNDRDCGMTNMETAWDFDPNYVTHHSFRLAHQQNLALNPDFDGSTYAAGLKNAYYLPAIDEYAEFLQSEYSAQHHNYLMTSTGENLLISPGEYGYVDGEDNTYLAYYWYYDGENGGHLYKISSYDTHDIIVFMEVELQ